MQKLTNVNVDKIEELLPHLYKVVSELSSIQDSRSYTLDRAAYSRDQLADIIRELELLKHDLRDDYGNGYAIQKGQK